MIATTIINSMSVNPSFGDLIIFDSSRWCAGWRTLSRAPFKHNVASHMPDRWWHFRPRRRIT
jgi:hypothetical protein